MKSRIEHPIVRQHFNRRAFLRGAGGAIAIGLPYLEGFPERSAWAAGEAPVFCLFMVAANGVVGKQFFPTATGALTADAFKGKAVEALSPFAANILMVKNVKYPSAAGSCGHAQGLAMSLTGLTNSGSGTGCQGAGPSADQVIATAVNPSGVAPWNLYSGAKSYIAERISFKSAGKVISAEVNPYVKFQSLMGVMPATGGNPAPTPAQTMTASSSAPPPASPAAPTQVDEYWKRRQSVVDVLADDLKSLQARADLSMDDKERLKTYVDSLRQTEVQMMAMGKDLAAQGNPVMTTPMTSAMIASCSADGVDATALNAMKGMKFTQAGNLIEDVVKMHMTVTALAFSCNATRVAALQWGDGTDATKYSGIGGPGWPFHQLSHRVPNDASSGTNPDAEAAHAKVDAIRMASLAYGLKQFQDRGLLDQSFVYWTNHIAEGPSHSHTNLPIIIAGSAGGKLKQGQYIDGSCDNSKVLSTLIQVAGGTPTNFGAGKGATLAGMLA